MNSQMARAHGHHYETDPNQLHQDAGLHAAGGHHEDEQHEKTSVMHKVKAKARKLKDTFGLKKHNHDHDHEYENDPDQDLDEEDDLDDELVEDPEVHVTPRNESAVGIGKDEKAKLGEPRSHLGQPSPTASAGIGHFGKDEKANSGEPMSHLGQPSPTTSTGIGHFDKHEKSNSGEPISHLGQPHLGQPSATTSAGIGHFDKHEKANSGEPMSHLGQPSPTASAEIFGHFDKHEKANSGEPMNHLGQPTPTTSAGIGHFDKHEKANSGEPLSHLGQPSPTTGIEHSNKDEKVKSGQPRIHLGQSSPTAFAGIGHSDKDEKMNSGQPKIHLGQSSPTASTGIGHFDKDEKVNSGQPRIHLDESIPTASPGIGHFDKDEKVNLDQRKINLGQSSPSKEGPHVPKDHGPGAFSSPDNYQTKLTDPIGASGKDANVEPLTHSFGKMDVNHEPEPKHKPFSGTGSHDQLSPNLPSIGTKTIPKSTQPGSQTFDGTKPEHHQPEDMDVDQQPRNQSSSYTDKICSATYAIAGTAVSAKNVVAAKLGYGVGSHDNVAPSEVKRDGEGEHTKSSTPAVGGYGQQIAEKLAPVYDIVAGAGTAVVSKVQGTVKGTGTDTSKGPVAGAGAEQDKGVTSKGYLAQKFTPGDEDKALSEVISEALHKKKDAYPEHIAKSMDNKVTDSPEVTKQLGTDEHVNKEGFENESGSGSQVVGNNKGVVDRVKGVVGSWFGTGVGDQIPPTESSRSPDSLPGVGASAVDEQNRVSGTAGSGVGHGSSAGSGVGHESTGIVR